MPFVPSPNARQVCPSIVPVPSSRVRVLGLQYAVLGTQATEEARTFASRSSDISTEWGPNKAVLVMHVQPPMDAAADGAPCETMVHAEAVVCAALRRYGGLTRLELWACCGALLRDAYHLEMVLVSPMAVVGCAFCPGGVRLVQLLSHLTQPPLYVACDRQLQGTLSLAQR